MNTKPLRLLQLTDPHLGGKSSETLLGLNTEESLIDVLVEVRDSAIQYDFIVATGDISNDGTLASYQRFIDRVKEYLPGIPLAWLPGNHDSPRTMQKLTQNAPLTGDFALGNWHFILLNSRIPFEEGGELSDFELHRLENLLAAHANQHTIVFLHHQPVPVDSLWIDQYLVKNCDRFFAILDRYPNVKAVCWGHVHQAFSRQRGNLQLLASPSTCIQFTPHSAQFSVDYLMPGFRSLELFSDGSIQSEVGRARDRIYCIDFASTGY